MDSTVFAAAVVATIVALVFCAIVRIGILEEARRGATPIWAYAFLPATMLALVALALGSEGSPFLTSLSSILIGMLLGASLAYFGFRAALSVWARRFRGPRDT